jgi:hypothetical protein
MADDWMLSAACHGAENPDMWHGPDSRSELARRINEAARQICLGCPVMQQCYDYYAALPRNLRLNVVAGGAIWSAAGHPEHPAMAGASHG